MIIKTDSFSCDILNPFAICLVPLIIFIPFPFSQSIAMTFFLPYINRLLIIPFIFHETIDIKTRRDLTVKSTNYTENNHMRHIIHNFRRVHGPHEEMILKDVQANK